MSDEMTSTPAVMPKTKRSRKVVAAALTIAIVGSAGAVGATMAFKVKSNGPGKAELSCSGGISSLAHVLNEQSSYFPGDPETVINRLKYDLDYNEYDESEPPLGDNFSYRIEELTTATHTGTHLDAPAHFIESGARSVDQLEASEMVWPAYIIDVRDSMTGTEEDGFQLGIDDIKAYEKKNGKIQRGSLVIIQTGLAEAFGTDGYFADAPGFSGEAVQWMIDARKIEAIGSDSFGPDATSDPDFSATYTILANDGVAIPGLTNLDSMTVRGDIVIAAPVPLENGSAFQVNPLACHGSSRGHNHHGSDWHKNRDHD